MKYGSRLLVLVGLTVSAVALLAGPAGADTPKTNAPLPAAAVLDQHTLDKRTAPGLKALKLADSRRETDVRAILEPYDQMLAAWHEAHDGELRRLWTDWADARVPGHQDDAKAAAAGSQIDAVYASLRPQHDAMLQQLATVLSPVEIDRVKDALTKTPGYGRTYDAYLQIIPALTDAQKTFVREQLLRAREQAMDAISKKEKIALFKKQKVQIEAYLDAQGYDWKALYGAFVARLKARTRK